MIKLKNFQVRDSINSINKLDGYIFKTGRTHYNLAKQLKLLTVLYDPTQTTAKQLAKSLNGDQEKAREYSDKIDEILNSDVDIERVYKVPMSELIEARLRDSSGVVHQAAVPAPALKELEWMIDDDLDKTTPPA